MLAFVSLDPTLSPIIVKDVLSKKKRAQLIGYDLTFTGRER